MGGCTVRWLSVHFLRKDGSTKTRIAALAITALTVVVGSARAAPNWVVLGVWRLQTIDIPGGELLANAGNYQELVVAANGDDLHIANAWPGPPLPMTLAHRSNNIAF